MEKKKEAKTRTSITIDPAVLTAVREHCEAKNVSVSSFIETAVQDSLAEWALAEDQRPKDTE